MKYKCIKEDCGGIKVFTEGKIYDVESKKEYGMNIHTIINDRGREVKLSDKTLSLYFSKEGK